MLKRAAIIAVLCGGGLLAAMHATGRLEVVTDLVWHPAPAPEEAAAGAAPEEERAATAVATEPSPSAAGGTGETLPEKDETLALAAPREAPEAAVLAGGAPDDTARGEPSAAAGGADEIAPLSAAISAEEGAAGATQSTAPAARDGTPAPDGGVAPAVPADGGALAALDPGTALEEAAGGVADAEGAVAGGDGLAGDEATASPRFDVVRVAPDGMAVIAGQAAPRSRVELLIDGEAAMSAAVDESGSFAIVADIGTTDAPRTLQLRLEGGAEASVAGAAIEITSAEAAALAATMSEDAAQPVAPTDDEPVGEAPEQAPVPDSALSGLSAPVVLLPRIDEEAGDAAAPTAVRAGAERVALIAPGATTVPRLVLDTLSYVEGQDGMAIGRAPAAARIRVFVNNAPATEIRSSDQGAWTASIPAAMMRRARLLRFEQVSEDGEVVYRLETRFSYSEAGATLALRERTITVERGDSLWRLAENIYGEGRRYSVIFGANDGLIRDPDLIYPEQEFVIPELVDEPASP